ncbi:MAG: phage shock protein operon transcriptional activator [Caulobacterales bacterium]|nr:phage shock protein operon transcriptional activator [Caulobacterales bacterium]
MAEPFDRAPELIGQSPAFLAALEHASAAAALDRPLLVIGERGTGKELVAARIHFLSPRWDRAYVKVNCAALSDELLESELFGHEAGAFTGATRRHEGRFERADGGTLFLDEIAVASGRVQEKILRVIEYGEFERVGGSETLAVDVRVIGATNEDLPAKAARGEFRADLLDRLAFDVVTLPPLRARWEDIPILAEHFGRRMTAELGAARFPGFSMRAMSALIDHPWPGNVRELKNVVERAVYRALAREDGDIEPIEQVSLDPFLSPWRPVPATGATPAPPAPPSADPTDDAAPALDPGQPFAEQVAAFERRLIEGALAAAGGHQGRAATRLGLTYHQLRGLLRKHAVATRRRGEKEGAT